jgi:hypothetical protein
MKKIASKNNILDKSNIKNVIKILVVGIPFIIIPGSSLLIPLIIIVKKYKNKKQTKL